MPGSLTSKVGLTAAVGWLEKSQLLIRPLSVTTTAACWFGRKKAFCSALFGSDGLAWSSASGAPLGARWSSVQTLSIGSATEEFGDQTELPVRTKA